MCLHRLSKLDCQSAASYARSLLIGLLALPSLTFADIEVNLSPKISLIHDKIALSLSKAKAGEKVMISCALQDENGRKWVSSAEFEADANGQIDISTMAPRSGTYSGIDPYGFFWSMGLDPESTDKSRFSHNSLAPLTYTFTITPEGEKPVQETLTRLVTVDGIKKTAVTEDGLAGTLFLPAGEGPFPAVIVLGGLEGGIPTDSYAVQLANQGYASLALAYFKAPGTPDNFAEIQLEYFASALHWLKSQKFVDPAKIAIVGTSTGAGAALLVASHYPEVTAVAGFMPAPFIFQSIDTMGLPKSTFTAHGEPLPFIPIASLPPTPDNLQTSYFLRLFVGNLIAQPISYLSAALIPVDMIKGQVLMQTALDDRFYSSAALSQYAYSPSIDFTAYKGTGHTLGGYGLPNTPTTILDMTVNSVTWFPGGNSKETAVSERQSWDKLFRFLKGSFS